MNALARTVPVVLAVAALIAAPEVGCGGGHPSPDASVDAGDGGGGPDGSPGRVLSIEPEPPILAVVGDSFQHPLHADGGVPPYAWSLRQDAGLAWLRVGPTTGTLVGDLEVTDGAVPFTVEVRDDAGQRASRDFEIVVNACVDGTPLACVLRTYGSACSVGTTTCSGGQPGQTCDPDGGHPSTDFEHCTNCQACVLATANQCVGGLCSCGGDAGCDGDAGQQCCLDTATSTHVCANLLSDPNFCGNCGTACPGYSHAPAKCDAGICSAPCEPGYASCDGGLACDTSILTDVNNCGACRHACTVPGTGGGTPFCDAGSCGYTCAPSANDCPGLGCTSKLDLDNCGACGVVCRPGAAHVLNGGPTCTASGCAGTCQSGWGNCNGDWSDGCESDLDAGTGLENCGQCGFSCTGYDYCSSGKCRIVCATDPAPLICTYPAYCSTCQGADCCR